MKPLCPICSDNLLRHLRRRKVLWFCPRCHQEMPNFDSVITHAIPHKSLKPNIFYDQHNKITINTKVKRKFKNPQSKSNLIDLYLNQDQNRLEVVNFILNQINIILANTFADKQKCPEKYENLSEQLQTNQLKIDTLTKAKFLRDSEAILLAICQAILVADNSNLNSLSLQDFDRQNNSVDFLVEQTYFIDLMKTLVVDFVKSISFNSAKSAGHFVAEVSSYFEIVISLLIQFE